MRKHWQKLVWASSSAIRLSCHCIICSSEVRCAITESAAESLGATILSHLGRVETLVRVVYVLIAIDVDDTRITRRLGGKLLQCSFS